MATTYTLNQLVKIITQIGLAHSQINTVDFCTLPELLNRQDVKYPAMCFEVFTAPVSSKKERFPFSFWFIDLALPGEHQHLTEIRSDMLSVSSDIVAMLMNENLYDFKVEDGITRDMFDGQMDSGDGTAGVFMELTISQAFGLNRCQVPGSGGVFTEEFTPQFT